MKKENLVAVVKLAAELTGQKIPRARLDHFKENAARIQADTPVAIMVYYAWGAAGLEGRPHVLPAPVPENLPFVCWEAERGWLVVVSQSANGNWKARDVSGNTVELAGLEACECVALPHKSDSAQPAPSAAGLVWQSIIHYRGVFFDAIVATTLVNLLALSTSLYSMQVYDRVIPNHGYQTLWVLTVGVMVSILLEFFLKHVRNIAIDKTCKSIDCELSEWFFQRALAIRMEGRPTSVGTLAAQIKGFELVRGVMSSAPLFVLVDIPFAILFTGIIALIGGVLAIVPVIALPVALLAGLVFQKAIAAHAKQNMVQSNLKTGLLVESIDGAESLKANGAEWKFLARWKKLVHETADSDFKLKKLSALSQNISAMLQQAGYVALVAFGAYLAADNIMTMGGLIACSIISGRAMAPIAQLPSVMVQWAHAQAAIVGLDHVIKLPNEIDEQANALVPQKLEGSFRFERVAFVYGAANHLALEIPQLHIRAGEKVGVLGGIGSGKSTLLKLASGLYRPVDGKLFIGDVDITLLSPAVVREMVGYLPQDFQLFSGTLRDNLLIGLPDPGDEIILQAAKLTGIIDLISGQPKGLALPISEGGRGVSGGQKQLIGLTRLLLAKPQVWILDEPTSSMDAQTEMRIVGLLNHLASRGATMLIATHKTALLPIFERLLMVKDGRVVLDGPREQMLAKLSGSNIPAAAQGV